MVALAVAVDLERAADHLNNLLDCAEITKKLLASLLPEMQKFEHCHV